VELVPDLSAQAWGLKGARLSLREASRYHINPLNLVQLLGPAALGGPADYFGHDNYWETVVSVGWVPFVLVAMAWSCSRRRRLVRGWTALLVLSLLFAAGRRFGLYILLYPLPGMGWFRVPARSLYLANLAAAGLAGLGLQAIAKGRIHRAFRTYVRLTLAVVAILLVGQVVAWWLGVGHDTASLFSGGAHAGPGNRYRELGRWLRSLTRMVHDPVFWPLLLSPGAVLLLRRNRGAGRFATALTLGSLAVGELVYHGHGVLRVAPVTRFLDCDPIAAALQEGPFVGPFRIRARDAYYTDLQTIASGLEKTNLNDSFQLQHAADLYEQLYPIFGRRLPGERLDPRLAKSRQAIRQAVLDRMNVAYLITDRRGGGPWPVVARGRWGLSSFLVLHNPTALPRAYVVPRAEVARGVRHLPLVPARAAVVVEADPLPGGGPRQPFTPASYDSTDPDRIRIRVTTSAPGLLVVADTWMPGWTATLNGGYAAVLRGNHAQRVVALPQAGAHEVVMRYEPPGLRLGLAVTSVSATVWLALVAGQIGKRQTGPTALEIPGRATRLGECGEA
jgi:hypothetical protein